MVENVCVPPIRPLREEMPEPPVELTISNENPPGAVEEAVSTFPSTPVTVAKAFVPEAIRTPRVNVAAPVPPFATVRAFVSVRLVKEGVEVTAKVGVPVAEVTVIFDPAVKDWTPSLIKV